MKTNYLKKFGAKIIFKIIDGEFLLITSKTETFKSFFNSYDKGIRFYNTARNHYYETIEAKSPAGKFLTLTQMLERFLNQI